MSFVPSSRVIWLVLGVALLAAVAGPLPELSPLWALAGASLLLVLIADFGLALNRRAVPAVRCPEIVRLTKDREGLINLHLLNEEPRQRSLLVGVALPGGLETKEVERTVTLPAGPGAFEVSWTCIPRRRGVFSGLLVCLETDSPLGFWMLRSRVPLACELRSYPNLFTERKTLAAIFLARSQFGQRLRTTVGRGREFEKLREYQSGDPFDEIHWKATAKRNAPVTKVFQSERTQEIYVVIDASRLSARAVSHEGRSVTTLERYITTALLLVLAASRQADRFGLVVFDDRIRAFVRAGQGPRHYAACRDALYALKPSASSPDMAEVTRHLRTCLRQRALLFVLSDLTDPVLAEDFVRQVGLLARQHLVMVNQLRPPGVAPLFTGAEISSDLEIYGKLAGHARWSESRSLAQRLRPLGVSVQLLENENMAEEVLSQYMRVKERQSL